LVSLNKNYPNIPGPNDFRPIIVMSPLRKFLEGRFLRVTTEYLKNTMRSPVGFVEGTGCHLNLIRLLKRLNTLRQNKTPD
jgi:hypothetical protein